MSLETGGRSHGPPLLAEELGERMDAPPTIDGGWEVKTLAGDFRSTSVGLREAQELRSRRHPETGVVLYEVRTITFGNGSQVRETAQNLTPDELFRRLR